MSSGMGGPVQAALPVRPAAPGYMGGGGMVLQDQGTSAASALSAQSGFSDGGWSHISTDSTTSDMGGMVGGYPPLFPPVPPPLPAAFPGTAPPSYSQVTQQRQEQQQFSSRPMHALTGNGGTAPPPPPPQQQQHQQQPRIVPAAGEPGGPIDSKYICRHFIKGRCTWGPECRFYHPRDQQELAGKPTTSPPLPPQQVAQQQLVQPMGAMRLPQQQPDQQQLLTHQFSQLSVQGQQQQQQPQPQQPSVPATLRPFPSRQQQPPQQQPPTPQQQQQQQLPPQHPQVLPQSQGAFHMYQSFQAPKQPLPQQQQQQQQPQQFYSHQQQMHSIQGVPQVLREGANMLLTYSPAPQGVSTEAHAQGKQREIVHERAPVIHAALSRAFKMDLSENGYEFCPTSLKRSFLLDRLLEGPALVVALQAAESYSNDIRTGGLVGLLSDETLFWSLMQAWHSSGTTGSPKWDEIVTRALAGELDCPFDAHCKMSGCGYKHKPLQ